MGKNNAGLPRLALLSVLNDEKIMIEIGRISGKCVYKVGVSLFHNGNG
jgi:hypothetical protein